ncbi:PA2928 family protein [Saccharothrix violaceirubra]|uniref:Uncharacterized protein n=1 Tax=Saccharothrix violaceirubra TaxID=413306 RepID=A0A7W7WY15_9PSEU|nr:PA2928 family protein [Saccharothrix violaceirubra]MBB4967233.1 hypothetical protein [Saccharothrix violaceirubra]
MYKTPYGTPRRTRLVAPFALLVPLVLFAGLFFGGSYLMTPDPEIEIKAGIGTGRVAGRDVVLVPYERSGPRGMWQLMFHDMFQVRLAAVDPRDGRVLWDVQLSDRLVWDAAVVAAGERYAFVATASGPVLLDLVDGSHVAGPDDIAGLGAKFVASPDAYVYDPEGRRVLTVDSDGTVLAIPVDGTAAQPVDVPGWRPEKIRRSESTTASEASLGDDKITVRERSGAPGEVLARGTGIGTEVFHGARIVVDGGRAVGAEAGRILVVHDRSVNDRSAAVSAVSLTTGAVTATLPLGSSGVDRAVVLPDGTAAIATDDEVVVATPEGRLTRLEVGDTDFFGTPSR